MILSHPGANMKSTTPYAVAGITIAGLIGITLTATDAVSTPTMRVLGPILILLGGFAGTAIGRYRSRV